MFAAVLGWARLTRERLDASADRRVALAAVAAGALALWIALPAHATDDTTDVLTFLLRRHFWELVLVAAAVAAAPDRARPWLQGLALTLLFYTDAFFWCETVWQRAGTVILWTLSGLLSWKLPVHRTGLRKALVVAVTVAMVACGRWLTYPQSILLLQFLFVCESMADRPARSWLECQRASSAAVMNAPPEQLLASTRAPSSIALGAALVAGVLVVGKLMSRLPRCGAGPQFFCVQSLGFELSGRLASHPGPMALVSVGLREALWLVHIGISFFAAAGVMRFMGVPVSMPMGNLARVRNFFDFWRAINTWRYELLRRVYLDNLLVFDAGVLGAISIVVVFVVSGIHHGVGWPGAGGGSPSMLLRWEIFWAAQGVLCSISFQWILYRMRKRVRAAALGRPRAPSNPLPSALVAAACCIGVLLAEGLLLSTEEVYSRVRPYWIVASDTPRRPDTAITRSAGEPRRVDGARSNTSPALGALGGGLLDAGDLYMVWRAATGEPELKWSRFDGVDWTPARSVASARSRFGPAVAVSQGHLQVSWTDLGDATVRWAWLEGDEWKVSPGKGERSGAGPALAAGSHTLSTAWRGVEPDRGMTWVRFDAKTQTIDGPKRLGTWETSDAPAIAEIDETLYAVWRGTGAEIRSFWWSAFDAEHDAWAPRRRVEGAVAGSGPALVTHTGFDAGFFSYRGAYLVWRGADLEPDIHWVPFPPTGVADERTGLVTCDRAGVALQGGTLILATRGREGTRCDAPSDYGGVWDTTSLWMTEAKVSR